MLTARTALVLLVSHVLAGGVGFALGIYLLPILIAPAGPTAAEVAHMASQSAYTGEFTRNREDSDSLHWGEGQVFIGSQAISFSGKLAPGPDYRLYLSPEFVETEVDFKRLSSIMVEVGSVKTFDNFLVPLPASIEPAKYNTVIVWCETFGQYITSAQYRKRDEI